MSELSKERCRPCEGGVDPIGADSARDILARLHADWTLSEDAREIRRDFRFRNFHETMGFVNAVAWIANTEDHHPDLEVGYRHCLVRFTTHAIKGLSRNDFICAARIDDLLSGG